MGIALIGFAGIGFFSEDLSAHICDYYGINPFEGTFLKNFHYFFSIVVFAGFIFSGFFIGLYYIFFSKSVAQKLKVEKYWFVFIFLGLEMLIWPPIHGVSFIIGLPPSEPFHEWFMLFSIFAWIIPTLTLLLRQIIKTSDKEIVKTDEKFSTRTYHFLTKPKVIKYSSSIGILLFAFTVIASYIIAQFDLAGYVSAPFSGDLINVSDPAGFNIFQDYFSNLGSYRFTPIPQIFNLGLICSSVFLIPTGFYMYDFISSNIGKKEIEDSKQILSKFLGMIFTISWIISFIGVFALGVFSEDVAEFVANITGPVIFNFNWHHIFAGLVFICFLISGCALGLLLLIYSDDFVENFDFKYKKVILYVISVVMLILVPIIYGVGLITLLPFLEWMYFSAISCWVIPLIIILYIQTNSRLE